MADYVERSGLQVADALCDFVEGPLLQGIGTAPSTFWDGLKSLLDELAPKNKALLETRDTLQAKIDAWAEARRGAKIDITEQKYNSFCVKGQHTKTQKNTVVQLPRK